MENTFTKRISALRHTMLQNGWDAVIVTGSDPHSSEYPASRWKQVEWLSGFTGEAGDIVVTADHAGLWTDTRYFIQAERQLAGTGVELHKTRVPEQVLIPDWLANVAFADCHRPVTIAVDGLCQGVSAIDDIRSAMEAAGREECPGDTPLGVIMSNGSEEGDEEKYLQPDFIACAENTGDGSGRRLSIGSCSAGQDSCPDGYRIVSVPDMLEVLWDGRPGIPSTPVITLGADIVGETRSSKISWLRAAAAQRGCDATLVTALDEIAWLLNVRGSDIEYNPLVISYLLVTAEDVDWFVMKDSEMDEDTVDSCDELRSEAVRIRPYGDISRALAGELEGIYWHRLLIDPATLNFDLYNTLKSGQPVAELCEDRSPVAMRKSLKNSVEVENMRDIHVEDGLAMERFLYWLETSLASGIRVTEWDAALRLGAFRAAIPGYMGDSFETISAYGAGAALPHYITPRHDAPALARRGLYLCDSGGQFMSGTTDITRTVPLGPCTMLEKEDYTLVLKGHINLAMAVFPRGTAGCQLDVLARGPLWKAHRNFGHGTGHGVGYFLGVHEGPQDIRQNFNKVPILPGMITSNEPGIYREGKHGIRHESLMLCVEDGSSDFGDWLRFETITLCHIDTSAVIVNLLNDAERTWLNDYNSRVCHTLAPHLPQELAEWLRHKCQAV